MLSDDVHFLEIGLHFDLPGNASLVDLPHEPGRVDLLYLQIVQLLQILFDFRLGEALVALEDERVGLDLFGLAGAVEGDVVLEELVGGVLFFEVAAGGGGVAVGLEGELAHQLGVPEQLGGVPGYKGHGLL